MKIINPISPVAIFKRDFTRVFGSECYNQLVENALKDDHKRIWDKWICDVYEVEPHMGSVVAICFKWANSPQGVEYWSEINAKWLNLKILTHENTKPSKI